MNGQDWHQLRNVVEAARAELDEPQLPPQLPRWPAPAVICAVLLLAALAAALAAVAIGTR